MSGVREKCELDVTTPGFFATKEEVLVAFRANAIDDKGKPNVPFNHAGGVPNRIDIGEHKGVSLYSLNGCMLRGGIKGIPAGTTLAKFKEENGFGVVRRTDPLPTLDEIREIIRLDLEADGKTHGTGRVKRGPWAGKIGYGTISYHLKAGHIQGVRKGQGIFEIKASMGLYQHIGIEKFEL